MCKRLSVRVFCVLLLFAAATRLAGAATESWQSPATKADGPIVFRVATAEGDNAQLAGKKAAESLKKLMGGAPLKAVIVSECFEDRENKAKLLAGIAAVLPEQLILGGATYGSFTHGGCTDADAVCLLGIGGEGISVSAALVTEMGASKLVYDAQKELIDNRLRQAGAALAKALARTDRDRLLILIADAHAPKNQPLVEGVQTVVGKPFPITGGCANKNAGQTFVYFAGRMIEDAGVAVMLGGDFRVSMSGRQAKDNDAVIRTAGQSAHEAMKKAQGAPALAMAFNCAGRRSKLKSFAEELAAIQKAIGKDLTLFGCYCAGEIGPIDPVERPSDATSGGSGWHIMFTVIGK